MTVNLVSLGCPKNLVDSEKILGALGASDVAISAFPEDSDIIIINTCGFIEPAIEETEAEIEKALQIVGSNTKKIYVYGCAVSRFGSQLKEKYPEVSAWFKLEQKKGLLKKISAESVKIKSRMVTTQGYAYLKIAEGCSNHCSYCTIPSIRGDYRSFDFDELIREAFELSKLGAKEIILIAQDTTRYGTDRYNKPMLVPLIREISKLIDIEWIRIMYAHPKTINQEIIDEISHNKKVCKYIDLPIQHINDRILHLMNRGVDRKKIEEILTQLGEIKGISLRTTVITGFPTETEDEFKELFEFLKTANFTWLGIFPYYRESDTKAGKLKPLPKSLAKKRYRQVIMLQKNLIEKNNAKRIGKTYKTLIQSNNGHYIGHTEFDAPEIDGQVITKAKDLDIGRFYCLKIKGMKGADLYAGTEDTE